MYRRSLAGPGFLALALALPACHRVSRDLGGGGATTTGNLETGAVYLDTNRSGTLDPGDVLQVFIPGLPEGSSPEDILADLSLPVVRDSFGENPIATFTDGVLSIEVGTDAQLKTRQSFSPQVLGANSPSGIEYVGDVVISDDIVPGLFSRSLDLGDGSEGLAAIDWDRNGFVDLVASTETELIVHSGSGETFTQAAIFEAPASGAARGVRVADLDRDGRDDVLQLTGGGLHVWMRTDAGLERVDAVYGTDVRDVAVFDANQDGSLDLAIADAGADTLLFGDGEGGFTPGGAGTNGTTHAVVAVDADRDGDVDLVKARFLDGVEELLLLSAEGNNFSESVLLSGVPVRHIVATDMDRDGDIDLALGLGGDGQGALRVLFNTGPGTYEERQHETSLVLASHILGNGPAVDLIVADLDSDGGADVIVAEADGLNVYMNRGQILRGCPGLSEGTANQMALADFDRDGDLDVVTTAPGTAHLHTGSLRGTWGLVRYQEAQAVGTLRTHSLAAGDVDNNGTVDLFTGNNVALERWERTGAQAPYERVEVLDLPATRVQDLELFDIDRDGDLDVLAAFEGAGASASGLWVALQDESGSFVEAPGLGGYVNPASSLSLADFDQDGDTDVALAGMNGAGDQLIRNLGYDGESWLGFDVATPLDAGISIHTSDIRFFDIDRDGDEDLLTGHIPGEPNRLWLQTDGGAFEAMDLPDSIDLNTRSLAMADLDLDGDLDLVTGNAIGERIWLRSGDQFVLFPTEINFSDTYELSLARINGDAFPDLVIANRGVANQEGVQVWFNQGLTDLGGQEGSGGLVWAGFDEGDMAPDFVLKKGSVGSVITGDFDLDGDVDIVSGSVSEEVDNALWRNL